MLFEQRLWAGLADGTVTVTFRRWRRPRARAGGRHVTPAGVLAVDAVAEVDPAAITEDDARAAGFGSLAELRRRLDRHGDGSVWRVDFHHAGADPREALRRQRDLPDAELAMLRARLDRLERAARDGPWTIATLRLIGDQPGVRAGDLAAGGRPGAPSVQDRRAQAQGAGPDREPGGRLPAVGPGAGRCWGGSGSRGRGSRRASTIPPDVACFGGRCGFGGQGQDCGSGCSRPRGRLVPGRGRAPGPRGPGAEAEPLRALGRRRPGRPAPGGGGRGSPARQPVLPRLLAGRGLGGPTPSGRPCASSACSPGPPRSAGPSCCGWSPTSDRPSGSGCCRWPSPRPPWWPRTCSAGGSGGPGRWRLAWPPPSPRAR